MKTIVVSEYKDCKKCPQLASKRKNIVWGHGNVHADLLLIGEAPGENEDDIGEPFVGRAGMQLWSMLEETEIPRGITYSTNAVLCRPTQIMPGMSTRLENRGPLPDEIASCRPRLLKEILVVDPFIILALGNHALRALTEKEMKVTAQIGQVFDISLKTPNGTIVSYPVMPLFHPSYILRDPTADEVAMMYRGLNLVKKVLDFYLKGG